MRLYSSRLCREKRWVTKESSGFTGWSLFQSSLKKDQQIGATDTGARMRFLCREAGPVGPQSPDAPLLCRGIQQPDDLHHPFLLIQLWLPYKQWLMKFNVQFDVFSTTKFQSNSVVRALTDTKSFSCSKKLRQNLANYAVLYYCNIHTCWWSKQQQNDLKIIRS